MVFKNLCILVLKMKVALALKRVKIRQTEDVMSIECGGWRLGGGEV